VRDYYEVLQVHPRAEAEVIRAAYRTLARKYHPDHGGDPARMIALNDAWDVLGDPSRRAEYDTARQVPGERGSSSGAPGGGGTANGRPGSPNGSASNWPSGAAWASSQAAGARTTDPGHAGPPPGRPSGTVLDFGRYAGWSLGEIARYDRDYLEWLLRATFGRKLRAEVEALLRPGGASAPGRGPAARPGHR
jgi:curved DNA-binding protein CbpA